MGSTEKFAGCVYEDLSGSHLRLADGAGPGTRGQSSRRACDFFAPAARTRVAGAGAARPVMRDERTIAYVQPTSSPPYYDDLTGEMLDTAKAEEAMQKERNSLNEFKTYEVIAPPLAEAAWTNEEAVIVRSKWVRILKADGTGRRKRAWWRSR